MQKIRIDFDNPGLPQHISALENDSQSRFFQATLYENGKAYTAPEGAAYSIMYRGFGPQNQGWYDTINDGAGKRAACKVSGNVVTCEIARQALQVPGHVSIVLCVTTGKGYMLKSWPIECDCKNDRYDSTVEIQSFFYVTQVSNADWTQAIQAVEELKNTIDPTLSLSGKAADAAKVGEAINAETTRAKAAEEANAKGVSKLKEDLTALVTVDYETVTTDRYEKRGELYSNKRFYFSSQGFVGYEVYVGDYDRKKLLEVDVKEGQKYKIFGQSGSSPRYNSAFAFVDENNICISYHWEENNNSAVNTTVPPNAVKLYVQAATIEPEAQLVIGHSTTYTNKSINTINRVLLDNNLSKFDDKFQVVAYSVITNDPAPINTKEHFENAAIKEFDSLKGDIAVTSDGALVMCHDKGYTFNSDGRITKYDASNSTAIHDMTYADIKSLEFEKQYNGVYVNPCDIDEFLQICKKYEKFPYITIRDEFMDVVVPTLITKLNYYHLSHKCIVNSFTLESLKAVRAASSEIYLSRVLNYKKMATTQNVDEIVNLGIACLCIFDDATMINENAEVCNYARTKGVRVWGGQGRTQNDIDAYINAGYSGVQSYVPLDAT